MFSTADTIVAIATPPGHGGIGIVRISGPDSARIAGQLTSRPRAFRPRLATLAAVHTAGAVIDRVLVTAFPGPHSYTGQDVVEISAHGSPVLLRAIVAEALRLGARLAEPGEFTLRAYLNGRIDLVQAEAVQDLVASVTPLQARAAFDQLEGTLTDAIREVDRALFDLGTRLEASLDFPAEGYHFVESGDARQELGALRRRVQELIASGERGRLIREGLHVVITGRPNTGKSSLFNALAGAGRAIVTDVAGTTRDLLTETIDIDGIPVTLVDTAGIRPAASDAIEAEGISRAVAARAVASAVLVVLDASVRLTRDDRGLLEEPSGMQRVVVANKCDLPSPWAPGEQQAATLTVSATTGEGLELLRTAICASVGGSAERDGPAVTNMRHVKLLTRVDEALGRADEAVSAEAPEEFVLADIAEARTALEEITGARTPDDVLAAIFSRFCIGK